MPTVEVAGAAAARDSEAGMLIGAIDPRLPITSCVVGVGFSRHVLATMLRVLFRPRVSMHRRIRSVGRV